MKKTILSMLILVLTMSLFLGVATVYAETYEKDELFQISDGVTFSDPNQPLLVTGLTLPTNYFVKYVEAVSTTGHIVSYNGVKLYVTDSEFRNMTKYDVNKHKPIENFTYSIAAIHVKHDIENEISDRPLYASKDCTPATKIPNSDTLYTDDLTFLSTGITTDGTPVYLVSRKSDGMIGYIKSKFTDSIGIAVPVAPTLELKPIEPEPTPDDPSTDGPVIPDTGDTILPEDGVTPETDDTVAPTKGNIVKIVLIVAICILAAVLVFLIFKPTRTNKGKYKVDDYDDYERDDEYNDRY